MKQGDALASTFGLFSIYINDLAKEIIALNSGICGRDMMRFLLYDDDIVLLSSSEETTNGWCKKCRHGHKQKAN